MPPQSAFSAYPSDFHPLKGNTSRRQAFSPCCPPTWACGFLPRAHCGMHWLPAGFPRSSAPASRYPSRSYPEATDNRIFSFPLSFWRWFPRFHYHAVSPGLPQARDTTPPYFLLCRPFLDELPPSSVPVCRCPSRNCPEVVDNRSPALPYSVRPDWKHCPALRPPPPVRPDSDPDWIPGADCPVPPDFRPSLTLRQAPSLF